MKKLTIIQQLWLFAAFFTLLIILMSGISYYHSTTLMTKLHTVGMNQLPAVRNITLIDMNHDAIRSTVLDGFYNLHKKNDEALKKVVTDKNEKIEEINKYFADLDQLDLDQDIKKASEDSKSDLKKYTDVSSKIVDTLAEKKETEAESLMPEFESSFRALEVKLEKLGELIEKAAEKKTDEGAGVMILGAMTALAGIFFGLAFSVLIILNLSRILSKFIHNISTSSLQVQEVSNKLAETNDNLANSSNETASSLAETVASVDELTSMVGLNNDNAKLAETTSQKSRVSVEKGESEVNELANSMNQIKDSSKKMEEIINVIDDIAFQTNLLALNAAVEAARAGEQGKGFAVVAEAVRNLAQRSASAAKEINTMIKDSVEKIENGSEKAETFKTSLHEIVASVQKVSEINAEISYASAEQTAGLKQISQAMDSLDAASQNNAQASLQVAESSNLMKEQAANLNQLIEEIKEAIFGNRKIHTLKDNIIEKTPPTSPVRKNTSSSKNINVKNNYSEKTKIKSSTSPNFISQILNFFNNPKKHETTKPTQKVEFKKTTSSGVEFKKSKTAEDILPMGDFSESKGRGIHKIENF